MITAPENFLHQALSFLQSAGLYGHLSMVQLTNDPFLNELNKMYERNKDKGTVWVTLKRSTLKSRRARQADPDAAQLCLIRATDGKKKISTTVSAKDHSRFAGSYATILKAHTGALKRREKEKRPKAKKPT